MMGAGMMGRGMVGGPAGAWSCPMAAEGGTPEAALLTEEKAKELAQQYADQYLKGFTVERMLQVHREARDDVLRGVKRAPTGRCGHSTSTRGETSWRSAVRRGERARLDAFAHGDPRGPGSSGVAGGRVESA